MVGFDDLDGLFHPKSFCFHDSMTLQAYLDQMLRKLVSLACLSMGVGLDDLQRSVQPEKNHRAKRTYINCVSTNTGLHVKNVSPFKLLF